MKLTKEDFESSLTEPPRSLTDEEIKQILDNQEKAEKWDKTNAKVQDDKQIQEIKQLKEEMNMRGTQYTLDIDKWKGLFYNAADEKNNLKDSIEFQLDKHTGKVGYEYITKILKEILN